MIRGIPFALGALLLVVSAMAVTTSPVLGVSGIVIGLVLVLYGMHLIKP